VRACVIVAWEVEGGPGAEAQVSVRVGVQACVSTRMLL